jgi:hypothetical protein
MFEMPVRNFQLKFGVLRQFFSRAFKHLPRIGNWRPILAGRPVLPFMWRLFFVACCVGLRAFFYGAGLFYFGLVFFLCDVCFWGVD